MDQSKKVKRVLIAMLAILAVLGGFAIFVIGKGLGNSVLIVGLVMDGFFCTGIAHILSKRELLSQIAKNW